MELGNWTLQGCAIIMMVLISSSGVEADEVELYKALITDSGYNLKVRPRRSHSDRVDVSTDLEILHIRGIDEVNQVFQIAALVISSWTDDYLTWNSSDYNGLEKIVIPASVIWTPDFVIENSASSLRDSDYINNFYCKIFSDGTVIWEFGDEFELVCVLDLTYYPLDSQSCFLEMANVAYDSQMVDLSNGSDEIIMASTLADDHGIWETLSTTATKSYVQPVPGSNVNFTHVSFTINLKRKTQYYVLNFIMPSIFILILTMSVFWLPCDSGEKVGLSVTVMLTFSVFQLTLTNITPANSRFSPVLCQFFLFAMGISCASTLSVVLVLFVHHHQVGRPSHRLRVVFFRHIARLMCMGSVVPKVEGITSVEDTKKNTVVPVSRSRIINQSCESFAKPIDINNKTTAPELARIALNLDYIVEQMRNKEYSDSSYDEWKLIAQILDRMLFCLMLFVTILVTIIFFVKAVLHG